MAEVSIVPTLSPNQDKLAQTAYDLKLIIDKGKHDVVKPSWIEDSISLGRPAPVYKRYFFHATEERMDTEEYNAEPEEATTEEDAAVAMSHPSEEKLTDAQSTTEGDWLDDDAKAAVDESETEPDEDSDNVDVEGSDVDEDWYAIRGVSTEGNNEEATVSNTSSGKARMGESAAAMEYDTELIFRHLCFYLDSPEAARRHGMTAKAKFEKEIDEAFFGLSKAISTNGGRIVDLDDPKLTHVVMDKRDDSRRVELIRRTCQPKRRQVVISEYIQACLDEGTLLDEEGFVP